MLTLVPSTTGATRESRHFLSPQRMVMQRLRSLQGVSLELCEIIVLALVAKTRSVEL